MWNASRAVREALDMIIAAETVRILLVDPVKGEIDHGDEPGSDLGAYLARHSANIVVDRLAPENRSASEVLQQHAIAMSADLLCTRRLMVIRGCASISSAA